MVVPEVKKPDTYVNVIVLVCERAPPAVGVKVKVTATPAVPATRLAAGISKIGEVTAAPMTPDTAAADKVGSALVDTFTSPDACATPMVKPVSVILMAVLAAIV